MKGAAKTALASLTGEKATVLIDKLGERLAFERTGLRLYEAFIAKVWSEQDVDGAAAIGPTVEELENIRLEECRHFELLTQCLVDLGADPTVQTPSADVIGVLSTGVLQVLTDPRTSVPQCLEAILTIELVDNASWQLLESLTRGLGYDDMTASFADARIAEQRHLRMVMGWASERLTHAAGATPPTEQAAQP